MHAVLGCDTTSSVYGLSKGLALKKFKCDHQFCEQASVFADENAEKDDIVSAGEKALVSLNNGWPNEALNHLRYRRFLEKVSKSTSLVEPQSLPPTAAAVKYHSLRVYYQVMQWKGQVLKPEEWGWQITGGKCLPLETDLPAVPSELLDVICCNCKTECATRKCSCRKYCLQCSAACRECHSLSCTNSLGPECTEED